MRNFLLILALATFGCNSNQRQTKQQEQVSANENCFAYPKAVDSLQIKDLYDSARLYVYMWHCDQSYLPKSNNSKSTRFGELPLHFKDLSLKNDTLQLNFDFLDERKPILTSMSRNHKELVTDVGFDMKTRKRIYMGSPDGFFIVEKGISTRYENPLQPEVLNYIKNNRDKLDSCFKNLAEQRGIMN